MNKSKKKKKKATKTEGKHTGHGQFLGIFQLGHLRVNLGNFLAQRLQFSLLSKQLQAQKAIKTQEK